MVKEKSIDESWKESAFSESETLDSKDGESGLYVSDFVKEEIKEEKEAKQGHEHSDDCSSEHDHGGSQADEAEVSFVNYVTSLGFQSLIFMGATPNPMTNEITKNLEQAKFLIDTLVMIKEKTQGNLSKQEEDLLGATCYELQLKYVEVSKESGSSDAGVANA